MQVGVRQVSPAQLGPVTHDIQDCAGIVRVTFSSSVEGATMEAFHPVLSPTVLNGGPQARADYGPGGQILLPVRGDGMPREEPPSQTEASLSSTSA